MLRLDRRGPESLGDEAYTIRFTPRRKGSIWSKVNVERFAALKADGQMTAAGERAYEENKHKSGLYAYERELAELSPEDEALFRRTRLPGPTGKSARPATARSCSTGSPAQRSRKPAPGASPS